MVPNITIGNRIISPYAICAVIGIFVAGIFGLYKVEKKERDEYLVILLCSAIGVLIGGHLLFAITNSAGIYDCIVNQRGWAELLSYFSGSVYYGGLIGALIAAKIYCACAHVEIRRYVDVSAMVIPLFHVFGRVGCFLSGCCYGIESEIGFVYEYSMVESANHVQRFPIQLVEAAGNLAIFFLLYAVWKRGALKQKLLSLYFVLYPVMRFVLEFFRGDAYRGFLFALSTSQIISIGLFCYGVVSLALEANKRRKAEQVLE